jgi:hypothetical protein
VLKAIFGERIEEEPEPSEAPKHHLRGRAGIMRASQAWDVILCVSSKHEYQGIVCALVDSAEGD